MPHDDYSGPVPTADITLSELWGAIGSMRTQKGNWETTSVASLIRLFKVESSCIDVLCVVNRPKNSSSGPIIAYTDIASCKIYPSRVEMDQSIHRMHRNAGIVIKHQGGGTTEIVLDNTQLITKTLLEILSPTLRPPVYSPKPEIVQKIDLYENCTSMDQILDFMTYYGISFTKDKQDDNVQINVNGRTKYRVIVNAFTPSRKGGVKAAVTTFEDVGIVSGVLPRAILFTTGHELISALGSIGIQVNEDVDDFRVVTRIKDTKGLKSQINSLDGPGNEIPFYSHLNSSLIEVISSLDKYIIPF